MLNKIKYKIKSLFRKEIYIVLDGITLNATYTNRYSKNQENEGKKMLEFLKSNGIEVKTMVDLGANFGEISLYFSKYAPEAKILAIEPSTKNYKVFRDNLIKQNFDTGNITIVKEAVSDHSGVLKITKVLGEQNNILNLNGRLEKVQGNTLESILKNANMDSIDFLKIDIEGAEFLIYESLVKLLPKIKCILVEISSDQRNIPLIKLLYGRGDIYLRNAGKWPGTEEELINYLLKEFNDLWFINSSYNR